MNSIYVVLALRLVHIVSGVFWAGSVIFLTWFVTPSIIGSGPAGGQVMEQLMRVRKMPFYLITAMLLTVLSGITLYGRDHEAFGSGWIHTGTGMTFTAGGILAIVGAAIGVFVNTPIAKRMSALGASIKSSGQPPTAEQAAMMATLQKRLLGASHLAAGLLILATVAMATARYVP